MPLSTLLRLAWRNLWRHYRRTLIMLGAISVGVWAMIFTTALSRGMIDQMVESGLQTLLGHAQIHHVDYRDDPSVVNRIDEPDPELRAALDRAGSWTQRIHVPAVVSSERETRGVELVGIEPQREQGISFLPDSIVAGRYFEDAVDDGVILGEKLAEELETGIGKRVVLMSQDPDNEIADRGFRVIGLYRAELEATEKRFAFVGLEVARELLQIGPTVSEIELVGSDYRNVAPLLAEVRPAVPPSAELLSWDQLDSYLGSMVAMMDGWVLVWMLIIFAALSFGLVNTLAMAVFERIREIGLMLALGMRPRSIWTLVVLEALMLLALGLLAGNVLAWLSIAPLRDGLDLSGLAEGMEMYGSGTVIYPALYLRDMLTATLVVIGLGALASAIPAWRAARLEPVRALAHT